MSSIPFYRATFTLTSDNTFRFMVESRAFKVLNYRDSAVHEKYLSLGRLMQNQN